MERRNFLKGIFGGVTSAGLIIAATPQDIEAFAAPLVKQEPLILDREPNVGGVIDFGQHLYNERGELVAVVTEIMVEYPHDTMASWDGTMHTYPAGLPDVSIRARGVAGLTTDFFGPMPRQR